jgi:hypothetical protein
LLTTVHDHIYLPPARQVARVSSLQAESARTAGAGAHLSRAAKWAEAAAAAVESLGGVGISSIEPDRLVVLITCRVPTSLAAGAWDAQRKGRLVRPPCG